MFDVGWSEMAVILMVALIVIGPKDLPRVGRTIGKWTAKARGMAREFQRSLDDMAREAELQDLKAEMDKLEPHRCPASDRGDHRPGRQLRRGLAAPGDSRRRARTPGGTATCARCRPGPETTTAALPARAAEAGSRSGAQSAASPAPDARAGARRLMPMIKDIDEREMPLLDHLLELRNRLVYSAIAVLVGFGMSYSSRVRSTASWCGRSRGSTKACIAPMRG